MSKLEDFKGEFRNPDLTVPFLFDNERQQRTENDNEIMRRVIEVIITCVYDKQCLPLRPHRKKIPDTNSGNVLAILRLLGKTNQTLKEHLDNPMAWNAQYLSPQIQNKIIGITADDVLQSDLIDEVKKFFSILANEVRSHHVEQLPICVRFVNKSDDISEQFLEFGRCTHVDDKAISNEILRIIKKADLDIMNYRSRL